MSCHAYICQLTQLCRGRVSHLFQVSIYELHRLGYLKCRRNIFMQLIKSVSLKKKKRKKRRHYILARNQPVNTNFSLSNQKTSVYLSLSCKTIYERLKPLYFTHKSILKY